MAGADRQAVGQSPDWDDVKRVFAAAVELPTHARHDLLAEADDAVRREVLALLTITDTRAGRLDRMPLATALADLDLEPGSRIDDYTILDRIGSGGMSAGVFKARDERHDREVAIKILRSRRNARQIEEQRVLGRLQHPNIAALYGSGTTDDGIAYLAMEYVDGLPIGRYSFEQGLSVDDRLRLVAQVCDSLDHAHRRLVIHRDLKPSNILVTADGTPKILDFGIAKVLDIDDLTVTSPEHRALSVPFTSPEQLTGGAMQTSSDIYSLGVLLYHLLIGRLPFDVEVPTALYSTAVREQPLTLRSMARSQRGFALESVPEPAPESTNRHFEGPFDADLEGVLLKAVEIEPDNRYASAADFGDDLLAVIEQRPVSARPATVVYRTSRFIRRNRTRLLVAGLGIAVLAAAGYWGLQASRQARVASQRATATSETLADLVDEAGEKPRNLWNPVVGSAEVFDPSTGTFSTVGSMIVPRQGHSAILLRDGRVLIVGGRGPDVTEVLDDTEIFDPATNSFIRGADMLAPRKDLPLVTMSDGTVMAVGGSSDGDYSTGTDRVDRYLPLEDRWQPVGRLAVPRRKPGVLLDDGKLVVAGGDYGCCDAKRTRAASTTWELFDPATGASEVFALPHPVRGAMALGDSTIVQPRPPRLLRYENRSWTSQLASPDVHHVHGVVTAAPNRFALADAGEPASTLFAVNRRGFTRVGATPGRTGGSLAALADGRLLIAGGRDPSEDRNREILCRLLNESLEQGAWNLAYETGIPPQELVLGLVTLTLARSGGSEPDCDATWAAFAENRSLFGSQDAGRARVDLVRRIPAPGAPLAGAEEQAALVGLLKTGLRWTGTDYEGHLNWRFDGHLVSPDGHSVRGIIRALDPDTDPARLDLKGEIQDDTILLWTGGDADTAEQAFAAPRRRIYRLRRTAEDVFQGTWMGARDPRPHAAIVVARFQRM